MPIVDLGEIGLFDDEQGQSSADVILLLHGWPYEASMWDEVAPAIAATSRRVIAPTLSEFGESRFLQNTVPRPGNSAMLALDMIDRP